MFKFLKELKDSISEGIKEGLEENRLEAAREEEEERQKNEESAKSLRATIDSVSKDERFAVAMSAPYREVYSGHLGSLAGKSTLGLHRIAINPDEHKDYKKLLDRDLARA